MRIEDTFTVDLYDVPLYLSPDPKSQLVGIGNYAVEIHFIAEEDEHLWWEISTRMFSDGTPIASAHITDETCRWLAGCIDRECASARISERIEEAIGERLPPWHNAHDEHRLGVFELLGRR